MTSISDFVSTYGASTTGTDTTKKSDSLGQADFLRLMTEQLQHQDPLNPMENSEFLGQLAQFSTVQGIQGLQTSMDGFKGSLATDQMLRGASLVGRSVLVPSAKMALGAEGSVNGVVAAPDAGTVTFDITDANGQSVRKITVQAEKAGEVAFEWDGKDAEGNRLAAGSYGVTATIGSGETKKDLSTYVESRVDSVTVGSDGVFLDLAGLGTAPLDYVLRIR
ncbi:flagellar hook capping FlgD N-terminal domain-containing protein [Lysobacter soli]|uniref:flagellar hook capping FlgD N-terminal domain-containing protein n=1 Tax=Lysobacter soli TaxID=453783 RepID=UPI00241044D3|nr:flagellar hook capping FlgD N-terminal domain-containing protein [Lysobacter soli]MDG2519156.1 flagellar hook capping FlgD N-terminal domain-containing protein [Lysobacter soli]